MNSMDMKLSIYESYKNGEITKDAAKRLMVALEDHHNDSELDSAMDEMAIAESAFMESAVNYSNGNEEFSVFEKKAETFGDKVKKAWEAFKKWVKSIIDAVGKKITQIKDKITGKDKGVFSKLPLDKIEKALKTVVSHLKPPYNTDDAAFMGCAALLTTSVAGGAVALKKFDFAIVNSIKDSLIKIDSKLLEIENKAEENGSKMIVVLRPIVNLANKAIMSVVEHATGAEKREAGKVGVAAASLKNAESDYDAENYSADVKAIRDQIKAIDENKVIPAKKKLETAMTARDAAFTAMQSANKNNPGEVASATSYFNSANKDVTNANKEWADAIKQRVPYIKKLKGLEGANQAYANAVTDHAKSVMNANCVFIRTSIAKASKLVSSVKTKEDAEKLSDAFNNYIDMIETFIKDLNDATAMFKEIDTPSKALIKRDKIENLKRATAEVAIYKRQLDALKTAAKKRGF